MPEQFLSKSKKTYNKSWKQLFSPSKWSKIILPGGKNLNKHFSFKDQYLDLKIRPSIGHCGPKTMSVQYFFQNDFKKA